MPMAPGTESVLQAEIRHLRARIAELENERQTQAKQAEEGRRTEVSEIAALYDSAPVGLCVLDVNLRFVRVNTRFAEMNGWPAAAHIGKTPGELNPEMGPVAEEALRRVLETGEPLLDLEVRGTTAAKPDIPRTWIEQWTPLKDAAGNVTGVWVSAVEVTERRQAEAQASRSQTTFSELVERAPFGIYVVDSQFRIAHMNAGSQTGAFRNVRPVIGRDFSEAMRILWPEPVAAEIIAHFRHTLETGEPYYSPRFTHPRHDAEIVESYEWELHRLRLPDGQYGVICYYFDSTKLRDAEAAVRESEQRYRALFDQMTEGFALHEIICDEQGVPCDYRFLDINPAFERLTGLRREDVAGKTLKEVLPGEDPFWIRTYGEVALTGAPARFDRYARELERHYDILAYRPAPGRFAVIFADITERKRADAALRESEERFRALAEALPAIVWTSDSGGAVDWFNQRWYQYTGEPRGSGEGWSWDKVCHPDDTARTLKRWELALQSGALFENELRIRRHDGEYRWFLVRAWPLRGGGGSVLRWFGTNTDIQDLKSAEEAVRRSREDLDRAQEVGQIGSWRLDVLRNVLAWSDENHRIFGVPKGTPLSYETFLGIVHPDDRECVDTRWSAGLRGEPYDIEHRIVADGRVKWVREQAFLEFDESGILLGGFGTTQDITERKLAEEEREEQVRRKDEFLAVLGHELRNPLAAISTAMQLLSDGVSPERRDTLTDIVGRQVAVLQRLVDDLLDLARVTHGKIELQKEGIDLSDVLQTVSATARSSVAGRRQELLVRLPAGYVRFMGDRVRLEQIVSNLLSNASKYTGCGGKIELSGAKDGSDVVIRCKDNGRGIPPGMQRMIFEPFTRVQLAGRSDEPGVGIGLALVKRLVELHGGTVAVESGGAETGSEFTVRLPLVEPPPARRRASRAGRAPQRRRALHIVIVEDNPDVAQTLEIAMEQAGHRVTVFVDGPSALSGLATLKPDALLLDIGLPGMDGYELAAKLRQQPNLRNTLFVGLSGFKQRAAANAKSDFDHYFVKPVDPEELLRVLEAGRSRRDVVQ